MNRVALGIDVASASWAANGSARVAFDEAAFLSVVPAAIRWPTEPLTPATLAAAIDRHAREHGVSAVSLDGPQGWRDPRTPEGTPGVGRRCEHQCNTQGKTGPYGVTYPGNQRPWIEFCIAVFDELLQKSNVHLAMDAPSSVPTDGYVLLECFPTSAWRASGLSALPGKNRRPDLAPYADALRRVYALPRFEVGSHDDLQAIVAALCGAGVVGGPVKPLLRGSVAVDALHDDGATRRVEGIIWDVQPRGGAVAMLVARERPAVSTPVTARTNAGGAPTACVTQGVLNHVNRTASDGAMMIALHGVPGGSKAQRVKVSLLIDGQEFVLIVGDSHAAWRTHQTAETVEAFETLFSTLADRPGERLRIDAVGILTA